MKELSEQEKTNAVELVVLASQLRADEKWVELKKITVDDHESAMAEKVRQQNPQMYQKRLDALKSCRINSVEDLADYEIKIVSEKPLIVRVTLFYGKRGWDQLMQDLTKVNSEWKVGNAVDSF